MEEPVPPYLFAFAVGDLGFREVGPRTRVYGEAAPALLDDAAREFAGTEDMIRQGEQLFGPYEWERFDLFVLPPSFPYGIRGHGEPEDGVLDATVIKGDASGAQVVAHELAHSWTGNLITNNTNDHFWLNKGFTTMQRGGLSKLYKERTELRWILELDGEIGRPAFDIFLKKYFATFKFQSIDTETFLDFLKANIPGIEQNIDLQLWTDSTGIPPDSKEPVSNIYSEIVSLANEFKLGRMKLQIGKGSNGNSSWRTCPNLLKLHRSWPWTNATGYQNQRIMR